MAWRYLEFPERTRRYLVIRIFTCRYIISLSVKDALMNLSKK